LPERGAVGVQDVRARAVGVRRTSMQLAVGNEEWG